jgi:hypothetical protein
VRLYAYIVAGLGLIAGAWWLHTHLINEGIQRQRDADAKEYAVKQREAAAETGRLKGRAEAAENARENEQAENDKYRREHPIHGGLCQRASADRPAVPSAAPAVEGDARAPAAAWSVPSLPLGDSGGEPDQLGMLDVLTRRCDALSAQVREWQRR